MCQRTNVRRDRISHNRLRVSWTDRQTVSGISSDSGSDKFELTRRATHSADSWREGDPVASVHEPPVNEELRDRPPDRLVGDSEPRPTADVDVARYRNEPRRCCAADDVIGVHFRSTPPPPPPSWTSASRNLQTVSD